MVAQEFHLSVSAVRAMPMPLFNEHVAFLNWRAAETERQSKKKKKQ